MPTLHEVLQLARILNQQLLENPALLKTEGIFRISSTPEKRQAVLNMIKANQSLDLSTMDVHAIVAAYKFPLQIEASSLITQLEAAPFFNDLKEQLISADCDEQQSAQLIYDAVINLVQSEALNDWYLAEIIHDYFHLAQKITDHQDDNKMGAQQMGVILGSFIANLFDMDAQTQMSRSSVLNKAAQGLIESELFSKTFINSYGSLSLTVHHKHLSSFAQTEQLLQQKYALMLEKRQMLQKEVAKICNELEGTEKLLRAHQLQPKKKKRIIKELEQQLAQLKQASDQGVRNLVAYKGILDDEQRSIEDIGATLASLRESMDYIEEQELQFASPPSRAPERSPPSVIYAPDLRSPKRKKGESSTSDEDLRDSTSIKKKR